MPIARNYLEDEPKDTDTSAPHGSSFSASRKLDSQSSPSPSQRRPRYDVAPDHSSNSAATLNARFNGRISPTETRQELIDRVKRDQRVTWLHNGGSLTAQPGPQKRSASRPVSPVAQSSYVSSDPPKQDDNGAGQMEAAMAIERPRSALHRGDFRQQASETQAIPPQPDSPRPSQNSWLSTSPTTPWFAPHHVPGRVPSLRQEQTAPAVRLQTDALTAPVQQRARAASYTARSASFVFRPPTSPLVNETQNSDSERDEFPGRGRNASPDARSRRRTFSPTHLRNMRQHSFQGQFSGLPGSSLTRENSLPYQAHQPRRSIGPLNDPMSLPQTPSARSRRPSVASETSPLQRMPMVGRYEESILRGRMSSLPSRPLDFVAQIGVLGKGKCKPSLRCPPHVTVPFPAVFYHYGSGAPTSPGASDGPSPYVGLIDIDSNLKLDDRPSKRVVSAPFRAPKQNTDGPATPMRIDGDIEQRPRRSKHRTTAEHPLPRGGYRIPEQGQLQIIIKNPNKTAVKLFLVPYDLSGMEPGQKTFIRQRSYSAGPILDMPLSARKNLGTDRPEAALSNSEDPNDRPVLRYLIQLNICCPSRGRWYLYKSIRVVFANRVPDGKEKLRQEIQVPEPRFSPWKPEKENATLQDQSRQPLHRFSYDGDYGTSHKVHEGGFAQHVADKANGTHVVDLQARNFTFPLKALPTNMSRPPSRQNADADGDVAMPDVDAALSPRSTNGSTRPSLLESPSLRPPSRHTFERLSRDEYSSGSDRDRTQSPQPGRGLLALQLRDYADGGSSL